MDPRISFSNDFADTQQAIKHESSYREAPVSSDFEFSVDNFGMISADEIIFKGTLLPLKDNGANNQLGNKTTTLRDELLADDEDYGDVLPRATNSLNRWKERLELKRAQIVQKNGDRGHSVLERIAEERRSVFVHEAVLISKESQEFLFGGFNCRDDGI